MAGLNQCLSLPSNPYATESCMEMVPLCTALQYHQPRPRIPGTYVYLHSILILAFHSEKHGSCPLPLHTHTRAHIPAISYPWVPEFPSQDPVTQGFLILRNSVDELSKTFLTRFPGLCSDRPQRGPGPGPGLFPLYFSAVPHVGPSLPSPHL